LGWRGHPRKARGGLATPDEPNSYIFFFFIFDYLGVVSAIPYRP
jgi:hypothetical protein